MKDIDIQSNTRIARVARTRFLGGLEIFSGLTAGALGLVIPYALMRPDSADELTMPWMIAGVAVSLAALLKSFLLVRAGFGTMGSGLEITRDRVLVHNHGKTYDLAFDEVEAFSSGMVDLGLGGSGPGIVLLLKNGDEVEICALTSDAWSGREDEGVADWKSVAVELDALVESQRALEDPPIARSVSA